MCSLGRIFDVLLDLGKLLLHCRVFLIAIPADMCEDLESELVLALGHEEAGRFGHEQEDEKETEWENGLDGEGQAPANWRVAVVDEAESESNPVGQSDTTVVCEEDQTEAPTAVGGFGDFGRPGWGDSVHVCDTNTGDDTGADIPDDGQSLIFLRYRVNTHMLVFWAPASNAVPSIHHKLPIWRVGKRPTWSDSHPDRRLPKIAPR